MIEMEFKFYLLGWFNLAFVMEYSSSNIESHILNVCYNTFYVIKIINYP